VSRETYIVCINVDLFAYTKFCNRRVTQLQEYARSLTEAKANSEKLPQALFTTINYRKGKKTNTPLLVCQL